MKAHSPAEPGAGQRRRTGRRGFLTGIGAGGLATAAAVFGFARPPGRVHVGCCLFCCSPTHTLSECETGTYYMWACADSTGGTCICCDHGFNPSCEHGCDDSHYTHASCS